MEIVGKIIQVLPEQSGTGKNGNPWKMKPFVLETLDQYPRKVAVEIFGDERIKNNPVSNGQMVTVSFDLESREYNGRWYTSVRAWKITQGDTTQSCIPSQTELAPATSEPEPVATFDPTPDANEPGLPF